MTRRLALFILVLTGCHQVHITVNDTFCMGEKPTTLEARIEQHTSPTKTGPAPGVPVRFFMHEQKLGEALTDAKGIARLMTPLPSGTTHYRAEAGIGNVKVSDEGLVFPFPAGRTVIVCDIDETVSMTHYRELVFDSRDDMWSKPFKDAAATLTELSGRFGLVYLTARPYFLLEKTKRWLLANGFPACPVITTPSVNQSLGVQAFKAERIGHLQKVVHTVGIGIGNANTDSEAYAMQDLLTIIIDDHDDNLFRSHAVILRNWQMVRAFFDANRGLLEDATKLSSAIDGEQMIQRPLIKYQKAK